MPPGINNLINLGELVLVNNKITNLPIDILEIKDILYIDETSYEINNMNVEIEIIIFSELSTEINNLPINLKEIWQKEGIDETLIKIPFGCEIKYI